MSKRSDMWRQAQVCMSLARATDDPLLKEQYEDLAVDLARNAECERTLEISSRLETGHSSPPRYRRGSSTAMPGGFGDSTGRCPSQEIVRGKRHEMFKS
jgi:hypothetical protein